MTVGGCWSLVLSRDKHILFFNLPRHLLVRLLVSSPATLSFNNPVNRPIVNMLQSTFFNFRDLSLEDAAMAASTRLGGAGSTVASSKDFKKMTIKELKSLLDSNNSIKLKNAMKSIAYKQATGNLGDEKALSLYTYVLKNVNCEDLKTKKMCFDFLVTYMPLDDSAAYLAMNSVQQLLHHKDPEARELSLTVLSKFKSKAALPLIMQFSKDMMTDFDFKVRRALCLTFRSCWEQKCLSDEDLAFILSTLMKDSNYEVVSSCIPLLKDLVQKDEQHLVTLHGFYKRFARDLNLFADYSFTSLIFVFKKYNSKFVSSDSEDFSCFISSLENIIATGDSSTKMLQALKLLIAYNKIKDRKLVVDAFFGLLSLNHGFNDIKQHILEFMLCISNNDDYSMKHLFSNEYGSLEPAVFMDSEKVQVLKVQLLARNLTLENVEFVFELFQKFAQISNISSEVRSVFLYGIVECCKIDSSYNSKAMSWIVNFMKSPLCKNDSDVNNAAFSLIRGITCQNSVEANLPAVYLLAKAILTKKNSSDKVYASDLFSDTKAGIIWLVGDYSTQKFALGAEVLKKLIPTYAFEDKNVRLQILTLAAKVYSHYKNSTENIEQDNIYQKMFETILELSKYDPEYDIIDRARTFDGLLNKCGNEIAQLLLQAPKHQFNYIDIKGSIPVSINKELQLPAINDDQFVDASQQRTNENKVNDFSQKHASISSTDFKSNGLGSQHEDIFSNNSKLSGQSHILKRTDEHVSVKNKKDYKLKTMEDFFAEESVYKAPQRKVVKKIIVVEDSDDSAEEEEEESEEEEEESEEGENESEDER